MRYRIITIIVVIFIIVVGHALSGPVGDNLDGYMFNAPPGYDIVDVMYRWDDGVPSAVALCHDILKDAYFVCDLGVWDVALADFIKMPNVFDTGFTLQPDIIPIGMDLIDDEVVFTCKSLGDRLYISYVCNNFMEPYSP